MNFDVLENQVKNSTGVNVYDFLGQKVQVGDIISYGHKNHLSLALCVIVSIEKDGAFRVVPLGKTKPVWLKTDYRRSSRLNMDVAQYAIVVSDLVEEKNQDIYKEAQTVLAKFYKLTKTGRAKKKCIVFMEYNQEKNCLKIIPEIIEYFSVNDIKEKIDVLKNKYKDNKNIYVFDDSTDFVPQEEFFANPKFMKHIYWLNFSKHYYFTDRFYRLSPTDNYQLLYASTWAFKNTFDDFDEKNKWHNVEYAYIPNEFKNGMLKFYYNLRKISYIATGDDIKIIDKKDIFKYEPSNY